MSIFPQTRFPAATDSFALMEARPTSALQSKLLSITNLNTPWSRIVKHCSLPLQVTGHSPIIRVLRHILIHFSVSQAGHQDVTAFRFHWSLIPWHYTRETILFVGAYGRESIDRVGFFVTVAILWRLMRRSRHTY